MTPRILSPEDLVKLKRHHTGSLFEKVYDHIAALEDRTDKLEDAFRSYGAHKEPCKNKCTCGFEDTLLYLVDQQQRPQPPGETAVWE